ncbi:MAG: SpvB/TcaC N-terminal domain-containing protein [Myxococcota bacterium]
MDAPGKTKEHLQAAPKLELPKGGGAIKGIGEKFQANPATGTASLSVPLPIPPGRGAFTPSLSLSYNSGGGNGPFGLGWSVGAPSIRRKTDKGLPEYHDRVDSDTFVLSDAEDLVAALKLSGGSWVADTTTASESSQTWDVRRYRPRVESGFARIERWTSQSTGDVHWKTFSRENVKRVYGRSASARLADPDDATRIFEWFLEEEYDEVGNTVLYTYKAEDRAGHAATAWEAMRDRDGNDCAYTYLKRVYYGNTTMGSVSGNWLFEVVFDYGEHTGTPATRGETDTWTTRQDVHSNFRSRFDVRCYRLCERVLVFHRFSGGADSDAKLTRSVALTYDSSAIASTLTRVRVTGWLPDGTSASMPPLDFEYQAATIDAAVQFVDGVDDLPPSLDISRYQWVDLDGEGLTGLLTEQGGAWWYKRNEGNGVLAPAALVRSRPNASLTGGDARLMDVDGDGRLELVRMGGGISGYHTRTADGGWEGFRYFRQIPNIDLNGPDVRMIDLDGDGRADMLVSEDRVFTWYPSEGTSGYAEARRAWKKRDEDLGPTVVFSSERETIFLADMNGDGLTDLVRVRNGNICYWPNRGYGRFGAKVQMQRAPRFDSPDRFDPKRVRLGDIDGAGPADLVYLGPDRVRIWFNESGNAWSATATELPQFPGVESSATISLADLLGDGTQCLVWSSPLLRDGYAPLRFVQLMAEGKPYLLTTIRNNLGRVTTLTYVPSTQFYVDDRASGTPWATKLPFPVQCLERVEVRDDVTGWRFATRYAYHHGYFDGREREFRGFGMVEQWDAEAIADFEDPAHALAPADVLNLDSVCTRTWYHTGAFLERGTLEDQYATEYYAGDTSAYEIAAVAFDTGLSAAEKREACRALKGSLLRQEVYAEDGSAAEAHPYTVMAQSYTVRQLQPPDDDVGGVYHVRPQEKLQYHYERDTNTTKDPRCVHELTLTVDDWGNVTRSGTVAYARRGTGHPTAEATEAILVTEAVVANDVDVTSSTRHVGVPCSKKAYHFTGASTTGLTAGRWTVEHLNARIDGGTIGSNTYTAATRVDYDATPSGATMRLLSHEKTSYFNGSGVETFYTSGSWPFGDRALVYQKYLRAFTPGHLTSSDAFDGNVNATAMSYAGYVTPTSEDGYWVPSGTRTLDSGNFYVATAYTDPFSKTTNVSWDTHRLFVTTVTDPLSNAVTAEIDYTALQPEKVNDPNGNWTRAVYDALGRVTEIRVVGKGGEGDPASEDEPASPPPTWPATPVAHPTVRFTYELDRWWDPGTGNPSLPVRVRTESRQAHGATPERWYDRYTYSDGGGNVIQEKVNAHPDGSTATTDWIGTGRVLLNNKGLPVKQYEPFFSSAGEFEFEDDVVATGVSPTIYYDPLGRAVEVVNPNLTLRRVEFDPWVQITYDENDLADEAVAAGATVDVTSDHLDTPTTVKLDVQGRAYRTFEFLATTTTPESETGALKTTLSLDVQGNPLTVNDALGVDTQTQSFDMLGRPIRTSSPDAGDTRALVDVSGQPIKVVRTGGLTLEYQYDELRRRTRLTVTEGTNTRIAEVNLYGEGQGTTLNHRGKLYKQWDTAGRVVFDSYDFKGNPLSSTRRFWNRTNGDTISWTATASTDDGKLESTAYTTSQEFDALDRPTSQTTPDTKETTFTYDDAGLLYGVAVDGTDYVTSIAYNARGQREELVYGNGTVTSYTYEPETFRLATLTTVRTNTDTLQALAYSYDPVGNILEITDDAQDTLYFNNTAVSPDKAFEYDALYRLKHATGREKTSRGQPYDGDPAWGSRPAAYDAVERYSEEYAYDDVGNVTSMVHKLGATTNWTRTFTYEVNGSSQPVSNRLISTTESAGTVEYQYDDRGNIVFLPHLYNDGATPDPTPNVTPDFRDQMARAELPTAGQYALYYYDANGQRVRKVVVKGADTEERRYLGAYEVWSRTGTSTQGRETLHVMDGEQRIAMIETNTVSSAVRKRYQLGNHLGTSVLEIDENEAIISYEEYHPYGTTAWWAGTSDTEVSAKRYRYTGKEKDEETGLHYHGARYYAPWLGRWTSADPIGLGDGPNRYAYVHGNPVGFRDPNGMQRRSGDGAKESFADRPEPGARREQIAREVLEEALEWGFPGVDGEGRYLDDWLPDLSSKPSMTPSESVEKGANRSILDRALGEPKNRLDCVEGAQLFQLEMRRRELGSDEFDRLIPVSGRDLNLPATSRSGSPLFSFLSQSRTGQQVTDYTNPASWKGARAGDRVYFSNMPDRGEAGNPPTGRPGFKELFHAKHGGSSVYQGENAIIIDFDSAGLPRFYVHGLSNREKPLWTASEIEEHLSRKYNEVAPAELEIDVSHLPDPVLYRLPE